MKVSPRLAMFAFSLAAAATSPATVTLQFSTAPVRATNWANGAGTGGSNLVWGIIVDAGNNGFDTAYSPNVDFGVSAGTGQSLSDINGNVVDDVLFLSANVMLTLTMAVDGAAVGDNFISSISSVPLTGDVSPDDGFAIVWFDQTTLSGNSSYGQKYGLFTDSAFLIPSDGSTVNFASAVFTGPEPLKPMTFSLIPEPSTTLLGLLGVTGLIRRRR